MLNQVILVGRLIEKPAIEKVDGKNYYATKIAVNRSFKNADGIYETDIVPIILWQVIAENTAEYCNKNDIIGVKGRIQIVDDKIQIIAEKITVLNSKKEKNESEEN